MSFAAHRIRRLTWLLRTTSTEFAFAQRRIVRNELESVLLPALERVFDQYSMDDQVLRIPKLTLHLAADVISVEDLAKRIEEQLDVVLSGLVRHPGAGRDLRDDLPIPAHPEHNQDRRHDTPHDTPRSVQHHAELHKLQNVRPLGIAEYRRELLIEYLRTGRISWQANTPIRSSMAEWLQVEAERLISDDHGAAAIIEGSLETRVAMSFRLLQLLPSAIRDSVLQNLSLRRDALIGAMLESATHAATGHYWQLRISAVLFALRDDDLPGVFEKDAVEILAAWSLPLAAGDISVALPAPHAGRQTAPTTGEQAARIEETQAAENEQSIPDKRAPATNFSNSLSDAEDSQLSSRSHSSNDSHDVTASHTPDDAVAWRIRPVDPPPAVDVPGLLAGDAGLILLHPFLPQLFQAVGIAATTRGPLSAEDLPRAATLLNWLATGRETVFEFELSLAKVLLGLTPHDPVFASDGLLSQTDRDEGDALLAAVVEHWSVLRQTSVAGLRASFLQRRGMLRDDEMGWRLQMETESFDVLLGQLPWSLNIVKMPWMKKPIFTDWPTP